MKKNSKRKIGYAVMSVSFVFLLLFVGLQTGLWSIWSGTTTCSSDGIGITFQFVDETQIPDCFVGDIMCYATLPSGKNKNMGGYEATHDSIEKINCKGSYGDKSFVSRYVENEGAGKYTVTCAGTYYLPSEDYSIPHEFEVSDDVTMNCPTFSDHCEDGTPINTCAENNPPMYCSRYGDLYPKASMCGCPSGTERETGGQGCVLPEENRPPEIPPDTEPVEDVDEDEILTPAQTQAETTEETGTDLSDIFGNLSDDEKTYGMILSFFGVFAGAGLIYKNKR